MIGTSTSTPHPFVPSWLKNEKNPPKFLLRYGDVLERELMEADLAGEHQAGDVWGHELQEAIVSGLRELGGTSAETLIALAEANFANTLESEGERAILLDACSKLATAWPPYRVLLAQQQRRQTLIPLVAFRRYCVGWENVDAPFSRGIDGMVDAAPLVAINPTVLKVAGWTAWNLQFGGGQEKNSASPSKSADDPAISNSGEPSPAADGSSAGSSTPKTPA